MKRSLLIMLALMLCAGLVVAEGQYESSAPQSRIKLATTTSTDNSGLLEALIPPFTEKSGIAVDVIAVGTGKALALGQNGDVDVVLVHARSREDQFVAEGYGVNRRDVMHNDFVLLGPASDPAGIKGMPDAAAALRKINDSESSFVSRGDDSGTHTKERALWNTAGIDPAGTWYKEAGQGMGTVITMADDMLGYTLADRGTYLSMRDKIDLQVLVEGDPRLFNPYGVMAVNPKLHRHVNYLGAMTFIGWLTSVEGQEIIGGFTKNGDLLFYPDVISE